MKLVITEKPFVAQSIAKVLSAGKRYDGYLAGKGYIVSWCVGHLVELSSPEKYNETYTKWRIEDLPIMPKKWQYEISDSTKKQFSVLKHLMRRDDVTQIIEATDAGREGELIFRLVYEQCNCRKPVERLWISSMEDSAIKAGLADMKPAIEYDNLYKAAICRERADWIVGINATRLFSCLNHQTLQVGRVMTPTLAMVVKRESEIQNFKTVPFFTVHLQFSGFSAESKRLESREEAEDVIRSCQGEGSTTITKIDRKEKIENPPLPYDLTSLQRDANRELGFTAKQTLDYAQSLYEKKLITYPRTDSRFLTDDMAASLIGRLSGIAGEIGIAVYQANDDSCRRMINGGKVSDHHAIIPTETSISTAIETLPAGEQKIWKMLASRFLSAAAGPFRYEETLCEIDCAGNLFTARGKTVLQEGWKEISKQMQMSSGEKEEKSRQRISRDLAEGVSLAFEEIRIKEGKTTPPQRYTEDSLLSAMERSGSPFFSEDENIPPVTKTSATEIIHSPIEQDISRTIMNVEPERKGLGTPATRAGIIEKLVSVGLMQRQGEKKTKYLVPTEKGTILISIVPELIQSPAMTAEWEMKLSLIEQGKYSESEFMSEITTMIAKLVKDSRAGYNSDIQDKQGNSFGKCPHCGANILDRPKGWFCSNDSCKFVLWKDHAFFKSIGKPLSAAMAMELISKQKLYLRDCVSKKTSRKYDTTVILHTDEEGKTSFSLEFDSTSKQESDTEEAT